MERFISATTPDPDLCLAIDWLKGFKSEISGWEAFVKSSAHHARANVNLMGFNNPGVCVNFLRRYRQKAKEYFCSPSKSSDTPRIASAHSLGAFLLLELLAHDDTAKALADKYDGIILANPFLGDRYHDSRLAQYYSTHARNRDRPVGSTVAERLILSFFKSTNGGFTENPTHHQSTVLHLEAQKFLEEVVARGGLSEHAYKIPIKIMIGKLDPVCDNEKIKAFAKDMGIEIIELEGFHNPLLENTQEQCKYLNECLEMAKGHRKHHAQPKPTPDNQCDLVAA